MKLFLISALAILVSAIVIRFAFMDRWEAPSPCDCKEIFSADQAVALPAARDLVGNGFYQYTLRVARIKCLTTFRDELPASTWSDTLGTDWGHSRAFFSGKCP